MLLAPAGNSRMLSSERSRAEFLPFCWLQARRRAGVHGTVYCGFGAGRRDEERSLEITFCGLSPWDAELIPAGTGKYASLQQDKRVFITEMGKHTIGLWQ